MSPPLKLTSSHHVRDWCSLVYGQPSYMGQVYQPHTNARLPLSGGDEREDATREKW